MISAVESMDRNLINNWNTVINKNDTVYFLGDLSFYSVEKTIEIVKKLNGKKHWIIGNHDKKLIKNTELTSLFEWVKDIETIYIQDNTVPKGRTKIILCHYPMLTWDGSHNGSWHLHGHSHNTLIHPSKYAIDVGVDANYYFPVSYEQVKKKILEAKV